MDLSLNIFIIPSPDFLNPVSGPLSCFCFAASTRRSFLTLFASQGHKNWVPESTQRIKLHLRLKESWYWLWRNTLYWAVPAWAWKSLSPHRSFSEFTAPVFFLSTVGLLCSLARLWFWLFPSLRSCYDKSSPSSLTKALTVDSKRGDAKGSPSLPPLPMCTFYNLTNMKHFSVIYNG